MSGIASGKDEPRTCRITFSEEILKLVVHHGVSPLALPRVSRVVRADLQPVPSRCCSVH